MHTLTSYSENTKRPKVVTKITSLTGTITITSQHHNITDNNDSNIIYKYL